MALTDTACKNATCIDDMAQQLYPDAQSLNLEVRPNGGKYWFWKYRFHGKERRLGYRQFASSTRAATSVARDPGSPARAAIDA